MCLGARAPKLKPFQNSETKKETGDACLGPSVCVGQSSSASAVARREEGVAAGSGRRAGVGRKSVTGFDGRVEVEEDPFEVAPPEVDTTLLHRAAKLDEMGLHSSRARYSRGKVCALYM
jgi:hypothetical protein